MTVLYKYLKKQHAVQLLKAGRLRIGTLYEYRKTEKHGEVIGDTEEGKKHLVMDVKNEQWTNSTQPNFARDFINIKGSNSVRIENVSFKKSETSPDYYVYCTTSTFDKEALKNFGYDCCVVISNSALFYQSITRCLNKKGKFIGSYPCVYTSRQVQYNRDHGIHPALIKGPRYSEQREVRALWQPHSKLVRPFFINCREAIKYCSLHEDL